MNKDIKLKRSNLWSKHITEIEGHLCVFKCVFLHNFK